MLTIRQKEILKFIIDEYIQSAQPVSSKILIEKYKLPYSSATIRSECAFLEETGLLEKTHVSSGRIPASLGYRYYVDNLMDVRNGDNDIKQQLENIFANRQLAIEDIIEQTAEILSAMTNLITVVIGSNSQEDCLKKIELVPISEENAVAIFISEKGHVVNKTFNIKDVTLKDLVLAIELFNSRLIGTKLEDIKEKMQALQPILEKQVLKHEYILQSFINTLVSFKKREHSTHGLQYMLDNPEFNDVNKIKEIVRFIEDYSPWKQFIKTEKEQQEYNQENIHILIGNELGKQTDDIAVISTDYHTGNKQIGQLAVIGPKRIDYDKMSELLDWISRKIEESF